MGTGLYLCLCREPRLQAVLSKQPQLRADSTPEALASIQKLFREDVEEAWQKRVTGAGIGLPISHCLNEARREADNRVAAWLRVDSNDMTCESPTRAQSEPQNSASCEIITSHTPEKYLFSSGRVQSIRAERRVDPEDGRAYTYEEMLAHHMGKYRKSATVALGDVQGRARAKAKFPQPPPTPPYMSAFYHSYWSVHAHTSLHSVQLV